MAIIDCDDKRFVEAASFYADKLDIPDDVVIIIKRKKNLKGQLGYCEAMPITDEIPFQSFFIAIEDKGKKSFEPPLSVLAHEMVHVKQYVYDELKEFAGYSVWKNKRVDDFPAGSEEYYFAPWEVEAYGMQVGLFELFLRSKHVVH